MNLPFEGWMRLDVSGDHEADENEPGRVSIQETECRCVFFVLAPGGMFGMAESEHIIKKAGVSKHHCYWHKTVQF